MRKDSFFSNNFSHLEEDTRNHFPQAKVEVNEDFRKDFFKNQDNEYSSKTIRDNPAIKETKEPEYKTDIKNHNKATNSAKVLLLTGAVGGTALIGAGTYIALSKPDVELLFSNGYKTVFKINKEFNENTDYDFEILKIDEETKEEYPYNDYYCSETLERFQTFYGLEPDSTYRYILNFDNEEIYNNVFTVTNKEYSGSFELMSFDSEGLNLELFFGRNDGPNIESTKIELGVYDYYSDEEIYVGTYNQEDTPNSMALVELPSTEYKLPKRVYITLKAEDELYYFEDFTQEENTEPIDIKPVVERVFVSATRIVYKVTGDLSGYTNVVPKLEYLADNDDESYAMLCSERDRYLIFEPYFEGGNYKFTYEIDGEILIDEDLTVPQNEYSSSYDVEYASYGLDLYLDCGTSLDATSSIRVCDYYTDEVLISNDYVFDREGYHELFSNIDYANHEKIYIQLLMNNELFMMDSFDLIDYSSIGQRLVANRNVLAYKKLFSSPDGSNYSYYLEYAEDYDEPGKIYYNYESEDEDPILVYSDLEAGARYRFYIFEDNTIIYEDIVQIEDAEYDVRSTFSSNPEEIIYLCSLSQQTVEDVSGTYIICDASTDEIVYQEDFDFFTDAAQGITDITISLDEVDIPTEIYEYVEINGTIYNLRYHNL